MQSPKTTGTLVLFGSGETGKYGRLVQEQLLLGMKKPVRVAIVETPAGFQPNVDTVIGNIRAFYEQDLHSFNPEVTIVPARRKGSGMDPHDPEVAAKLFTSDVIFCGSGSPTYVARQLADTATLAAIRTRWHDGALLVMASAAAIAASKLIVPVYEIIMAGEDLEWRPGLDLLGDIGLSMAVIPHWNYESDRADHDVSRCFLGPDRFADLLRELPAGVGVLGIDEDTAVVIDPAASIATVRGAGTATAIIDGQWTIYATGEQFTLAPFLIGATA